MKIYNDIQQGTPEWKEFRWGKIGGSTAEKIMVQKINDAAIIDQLVYEHTEDFVDEDEYLSADMQRGNDLEPFARQELEREVGFKFTVPGWIQSDIDILGISPDGINLEHMAACELKCPSGKTHAKYLRNNNALIIDYAWQIIDYFATIPDLKTLYVVSFRPESKVKRLLVIKLTRDSLIYTSGAAKAAQELISVLFEQLQKRAKEVQDIVKAEINRISF